MLTDPKDQLDALRTYIDGKMRRYSLLFSVNGGAFAIAQFMSSEPKAAPGELTGFRIAIGAILFTVLLTTDIWSWGAMMKARFVPEAFTVVGKAILVLLSLLLILAWSLAVSSWTAAGLGIVALSTAVAWLALRNA